MSETAVTKATPPGRGRPPENWRQRFLTAMRATFNVRHSCRFAGVSWKTAYRVRRREPKFAAAWDKAREQGLVRVRHRLEESIINVAIKGSKIELYKDGELVRRERRYYPALMMFAAERLMPERYFVKPQIVEDPQEFAAQVRGIIAQGRARVPGATVIDVEAKPVENGNGHAGNGAANGAAA